MTLESAISAVPVMLIVWAVLTACFVGLLTYRGQLTRYEQERLFLTNINPTGEREQSEIIKRINQVQPYVRVFGVLATVVTVSIVALWTVDAWKTLHS
jgi:hypothetical protein